MFPFLSSARIHLNSRCLSQAVFDSGSVWFWCRGDKTIFVEGLGAVLQVSALAGTSRGQVRRQAEIPEEQQPQPISRMDEVLLRRERWGLSAARLAAQPCGLALTSAAGKERGSLGCQAAPYPGLGPEQGCVTASSRRWEVCMRGQCKSLSSREFGVFLHPRCNSSRCFFLYWQGKAMNLLDECKKTFKLEWELTLVSAS